MADDKSKQVIIIKKVVKGGHASHGGAWKIAYADFVTAMMAFFLLLWLLNSVTQEQLEGISNYFAPVNVAYLGPEHSYSHVAAIEYFGSSADAISNFRTYSTSGSKAIWSTRLWGMLALLRRIRR